MNGAESKQEYDFEVKLTDVNGNVSEKVVHAARPTTVVEEARAKGIQVSSIKRIPTLPPPHIRADDFIIFNRQLAAMVKSKVPLIQSLKILSNNIRSRRFRSVISQVTEDIKSGISLPDAMAKHPNVFPELYTNLIAAGIEAGDLPGTLGTLIAHSETLVRLRRNMREAMIYPIILILACMWLIGFNISYIFPRFDILYRQVHLQMPLLARFAIFIKAKGVMIINAAVICAIVILIAYWLLSNLKRGRYFLDAIKLKVPILSSLLRPFIMARFCETFAALLKGRVPILRSLTLLGQASGNKVLEQIVRDMSIRIENGESISESLKRHNVFPYTLAWAVSFGEKSGDLEKSFSEMAKLYQDQANRIAQMIQAFILPAIAFVMGIFVLLTVIMVASPLVKFIENSNY